MLSERKVRGLALLFMATYMVSYITRVNFGAVISEIEADTQIARTLLSMSVTGSFITYGAGQIISGICGEKIGTGGTRHYYADESSYSFVRECLSDAWGVVRERLCTGFYVAAYSETYGCCFLRRIL